MKRNPRKVKWTKAYRRLHGKDMTKVSFLHLFVEQIGFCLHLFNCCFICIIQDSTFEFERWRHRPHKYDRNVTEDTLKAIKKIDKIRMDRESRHIARRLKIPSIPICYMPIFFANAISVVTQDRSHLQTPRKESKGVQRGKEGIGSKHQFGQSTFCSQGGSFPHPSKAQSQSGTITIRARSYGRMSSFI